MDDPTFSALNFKEKELLKKRLLQPFPSPSSSAYNKIRFLNFCYIAIDHMLHKDDNKKTIFL